MKIIKWKPEQNELLEDSSELYWAVTVVVTILILVACVVYAISDMSVQL